MKFCPKCEVKLKKGTSGLECSKCGYTEGAEEKQTKKIVETEEQEESILAFEGNEGEEGGLAVGYLWENSACVYEGGGESAGVWG